MSGSQRASRYASLVSILALVVGACGGAAPSVASAPSATNAAPPSSGASGAAPSGSGPDGIALVEFADTDDPTAAARGEIDLVHEMRDDAGMPALIGAKGPAAFSTLDSIEAAYGKTILKDVSAAIASGRTPRLASVGGTPVSPQDLPRAVDISMFAETGFTANAIMHLYSGLVEQAARSNEGTLSKHEHFSQTADGLRQEVDLNMVLAIKTGDGRASGDITLSATDNIFDAATGSFVALYTSATTGHFDVNACPDRDGVGKGTYYFETKHEMNDVSAASASRSGASRSAEAPFKLINGDDAKLLRIEAALDIKAGAHGPGTAGGPGPTGPFDWGIGQQLQLVMPASGGTTATSTGLSATGSGFSVGGATGALFMSSALTQWFLGELGKAAEKFWRSGECIELTTNPESRPVDPDEMIELKVDAKHKFDNRQPVTAPIKAAFNGTKSLEPVGTPRVPPAKFDFKAGPNLGDKGTIDLKQTGKRGIGLKQVVFTVEDKALLLSVTSKNVARFGTVTFTYRGTITDLRLRRDGDAYQGRGKVEVSFDMTLVAPKASCTGHASRTYEIGAKGVPIPDVPDQLDVTFEYPMGVLDQVTITCNGKAHPALWTGLMVLLPVSGQATRLTIDQTTHVTVRLGTTPSTVDITLRKAR